MVERSASLQKAILYKGPESSLSELAMLIDNPYYDLNAIVRHDCSTALHVAVEQCGFQGADRMVVMLLASGRVNVNARDHSYCRTPLHYAALMGYPHVVRLLIDDPKCDLNIVDVDGNAPIHLALNNLRFDASKDWASPERPGRRPNDNDNSSQLKLLGYFLSEAGGRCQVNLATGVKKETILHLGCASEMVVKAILDCKEFNNYEAKDRDGNTALRHLLKHSEEALEPTLLLMDSNHFSLFELDKAHMQTLLHVAVTNRKAKTVTALLQRNGHIINWGDKEGNTALHEASGECRCEDITEALLSHPLCDANVKGGPMMLTPFLTAVRMAPYEMVRLLVNSGKCDIEARDFRGNTALHIATGYCDWDRFGDATYLEIKYRKILTLLLESGKLSIDVRNTKSMTPLMLAVQTPWPHMTTNKKVREMLSLGADVNATDGDGNTALHYFTTKVTLHPAWDSELLSLLFANGADANSKDAIAVLDAIAFRGKEGDQTILNVLAMEGTGHTTIILTNNKVKDQKFDCNVIEGTGPTATNLPQKKIKSKKCIVM